MIRGIGVDIICTSRIIKIFERRKTFVERFCKRILRIDEQDTRPDLNDKNKLIFWISVRFLSRILVVEGQVILIDGLQKKQLLKQ